MSKYFWYSKGSKETGSMLAEKLGFTAAQHGTTLPTNFCGAVVCWGANPDPKKFKWETRNIRAIFNDPREARQYNDRKTMFDKLDEAGLGVPSFVALTPEAEYANVCNILATTEAEGFLTCRSSGARLRHVTSQESLTAAIGEGCVRAAERRFGSSARIRVFVCDGNVVGALQRTPSAADETFIERATVEALEGWANAPVKATVHATLQRLLSKSLVVPGKSYWAPHALASQAKRNAALSAAAALGYNFCAVDVEAAANTHDVLNVVITPGLVDTKTVQAPIVAALDVWISQNTMTPQEILQAMVNDIRNDEEAEALIEELRRIKAEGQAPAEVQGQ